MKPICVACQCFYRPKQNGFVFTEMMPVGYEGTSPEDRRGTKAPDLWTPYKLWRGDLWKCPECGHELVSGVAMQPLSEHYLPNFEGMRQAFGSQLDVNDC